MSLEIEVAESNSGLERCDEDKTEEHSDRLEEDDHGVDLDVVDLLPETVLDSAVKRSIGSTTGCTITEKAPTRAFSWLKAPTSAFTFKTLLRHYAKWALTPR